MDLKEVLAGLTEHKEAPELKKAIQALLTPDVVLASVTPEIGKQWLESAEGEKAIRSGSIATVEKRVTEAQTKALERSKADLEAANKGKLTVEEQLTKIQAELEDGKRAAARAIKESGLIKKATELGLPADFVKNWDLTRDDKELYANLEDTAKVMAEREKAAQAKVVGDHARKPGSGEPPKDSTDWSKLSPKEAMDRAVKEREAREPSLKPA